MNYARLTEKQKVLADEVSALLADADAIETAEDTRFGKDKRGDDLPPELARRQSRLVKLAQARAALEAEAAARARKDAEKKAHEKGDDSETAAQKGEETAGNAVVAPTAQRNFTDPDARIMKTANGSFHYAYNAHAIVEQDHQVIVATTLTNIGVDVEQVVPLMKKLHDAVGGLPGRSWLMPGIV